MSSILLFLCAAVATAQTNLSQSNAIVDEKLEYRLYWGIVPVGEAYLNTRIVTNEGVERISVTLTATTGSLVSKLYPVNHFSESLMDTATLLPVRFTQNLREGNKRRNDIATFDHGTTNVEWVSLGEAETNNIAIEPGTRDLLSYIYFMRYSGMNVGDTNSFRVVVDGDLYEVFVKCHERERVNLSGFGKVDCLSVEPKAMFGEVFVRKGTLNMWFSDDSRRVCVKADVKIPVAKVRAILKSVAGSGDDFWIRQSEHKGRP